MYGSIEFCLCEHPGNYHPGQGTEYFHHLESSLISSKLILACPRGNHCLLSPWMHNALSLTYTELQTMDHFVSGFFPSVQILRFAHVLVSILCSLILLSGLPVSDAATGYLCISLLMGIGLCSALGCMCLFFSFPWGVYLGMEFLVNRRDMGLPLLELLTSFSNMVLHSCRKRMRISLASYFCKRLEFFRLLSHSQST